MTERGALLDWIEESIDRGAETVEEIHRAIADLPLDVLERNGVVAESAADLRRVQDSSIEAVYDLVRDINHQVVKLAGDLLDTRRPEAGRAEAQTDPAS